MLASAANVLRASFVVFALASLLSGCPLTDDRRPTDARADAPDGG